MDNTRTNLILLISKLSNRFYFVFDIIGRVSIQDVSPRRHDQSCNNQFSSWDRFIVVTDLKTLDLRFPLKNNLTLSASESIIFQRNKMLGFVEWEIVKAVWHCCNNEQWVLIHLKIQVWVIFYESLEMIYAFSAYWTCTIIWLWNDCCPKWSSSLVEML